MTKKNKSHTPLAAITDNIMVGWDLPCWMRGAVVEAVRRGARAGIEAVAEPEATPALPHSEHRGWDSLFDNVAAVKPADDGDDDCSLRRCDVCSGQHTGPGQTCPACRAPAGPPDLGDVLRRAESAIEDLPADEADEFEAFCAAHPGLWAALVAESAGRG